MEGPWSRSKTPAQASLFRGLSIRVNSWQFLCLSSYVRRKEKVLRFLPYDLTFFGNGELLSRHDPNSSGGKNSLSIF